MDRDHRPGIKSTQTVFAILDVISETEGCRLTDIANELEMSKSTVHDHLASLRDGGFVNRSGDEYTLGLKLFDYGIQARNQWDIFDAAEPKIEELAASVGERTWCFVEYDHRLVYLCGAAAATQVKTPHRLGRHAYLHHLAGGKAMLAHFPEEYVREIIDEHGLPPVTENTITDEDELFEELEEIRRTGIAYNDEEAMIGLRAIGTVIKSVDDEVYGSIALSGPANRFSEDRIEAELREPLLGTANEIELNLRNF
ncbi:IclR family transcriptional regulator [Natrarchaeobaculum aegyptiacum]|uniref:IclR family transcriptional regulator n=1 Tax=Natrarchaeobaculum aegyptiacum TaxID=745377 RepID=A0A2Z2I1B8_9EURY|nr:IclR family transcriptional regulator [Natrarchaeobaculum aegyptiacum]ARS90208.1 hypothetical protein B1756_11050 [Natrarchaeobaculum aegyptiacum]